MGNGEGVMERTARTLLQSAASSTGSGALGLHRSPATTHHLLGFGAAARLLGKFHRRRSPAHERRQQRDARRVKRDGDWPGGGDKRAELILVGGDCDATGTQASSGLSCGLDLVNWSTVWCWHSRLCHEEMVAAFGTRCWWQRSVQ